MVLLPPGRRAPPKEGPVVNRVSSSMGCVQKVPLTWVTPAVIIKRLSAGMTDSAQVSQVCLFSCCVGFGRMGRYWCCPPLGGIAPDAVETGVKIFRLG